MNEYAGQAKDQFNKMTGNDATSQAKDGASKLGDSASNYANQAKDQAGEYANQAKEQAGKLGEQFKN